MIDCYREGMNRIKFNDHFAAIRCILMILIISISTPLRADEPACPEPTREAAKAFIIRPVLLALTLWLIWIAMLFWWDPMIVKLAS